MISPFQTGLASNQAHQVTNPYQQNRVLGAGGWGGAPRPQAPSSGGGQVSTMPTGQPSSMPAPQSSFESGSMNDGSRPWEYDYSGTAGMPGGDGGGWGYGSGGLPAGGKMVDGKYYGNSANNGHEGGDYWGMGPQGYGHYVGHSGAENSMRAQQFYLKKFQDQMPQMNNEMSSQLLQDTSRGMYQGIHQSKRGMAARGMLHSGMAAGQEAGIRGSAAESYAQGKENINTGLINAEEKMMSNTAKTGFDFQQQQQQMENAIYSEALKSFQANAGMFGEAAGVAGMAGGMALSGGNPYVGIAGYQAGKTAGSGAY